MKTKILELYRKSAIARKILHFPVKIYTSAINRLLSDEEWCRDMFAICQGYPLDLKAPKTLNEKIQWLKLYNRHSEYTQWADKYAVREHISRLLGDRYLIPLLAVSDDPDSIAFDTLEEPFIIKPTHSSGKTIKVRDKSRTDWSFVSKECNKWLRSNLYRDGRELQYKDIPPRIIVERLLTDSSGNMPFDYKFHCFHGKIKSIQVDIDRETDHRRNFYDCTWKQLPFTWSVCVGETPLWGAGRTVAKPESLDEMINITEMLAKAFPYIRIDWYDVNGKIYFGEVTFHHGGGFERIIPFEWDLNFGEELNLPVRASQS